MATFRRNIPSPSSGLKTVCHRFLFETLASADKPTRRQNPGHHYHHHHNSHRRENLRYHISVVKWSNNNTWNRAQHFPTSVPKLAIPSHYVRLHTHCTCENFSDDETSCIKLMKCVLLLYTRCDGVNRPSRWAKLWTSLRVAEGSCTCYVTL